MEMSKMLRTIEAVIEPGGGVRLLEPVRLKTPQRAIVTLLGGIPEEEGITLLSEAALSEDWLKPEEDKAWEHLQLNKAATDRLKAPPSLYGTPDQGA